MIKFHILYIKSNTYYIFFNIKIISYFKEPLILFINYKFFIINELIITYIIIDE